jgi:hypothetical protein
MRLVRLPFVLLGRWIEKHLDDACLCWTIEGDEEW